MRKTGLARGIALGAVGTLLVIGAAAATYIVSGSADVAADSPHAPFVAYVLESAREQAIHERSEALAVPGDLDAPARVLQGAGNYDAMCVQCHLAPGMGPTELSRGLNPAPPNLTREEVDAAETFWVVKHGIKMTGMPAWGHSMADEYVWNLAAFVKRLPGLDEAGYRDLVARSGGHSHGGGESGGHGHGGDEPAAAGTDHPHPPGTPADHHGAPAAPAGTTAHVHADGQLHEHAATAGNATPAVSKPVKPTPTAPAAPAANERSAMTTAPEKPVEPESHDHLDHQH